MNEGLERINAMPDDELAGELAHCCPSRRWVDTVLARRPFATSHDLLAVASDAWQGLDDDDLREAFVAASEPAVTASDEGTRAAAGIALELYRERFGYPFITDAADSTADELLMLIRIRLGHDEGPELKRTRSEHIRLTRSRLLRLLERET